MVRVNVIDISKNVIESNNNNNGNLLKWHIRFYVYD